MVNKKFLSQILFAIFMWAFLICFAGYRFGTGDHPEYLPYVLFLNDSTLYSNDFFVQGLQEKCLNERTVVAYLLLPFVHHLEIACFVFHFLFTTLLIVGLQLLGNLLIRNLLFTQIAILINFLFFYDRGLGNVELYADAIQGSSMSVAVIAFALYFFFSNRWMAASLLMSIASILHPIEGLTVMLVMTATMAVKIFPYEHAKARNLLWPLLLYASSAGVFILFLLSGKIDGVSAFTQSFDRHTFFSIYHEFRHAHHYVFHYFPAPEKIAFLFFTLLNVTWGAFHHKKFMQFNLFAFGGTFVYVVCTDYLHIIDVANLQFFKVSQWVKFFAVLIATKLMVSWWGGVTFTPLLKRYNLHLLSGGIVILFILLLYKPTAFMRKNMYYQYGNSWKKEDDAVSICLDVSTKIPQNAVFVQPFSCTELKYFGRASSWVDWKAFLKNRSQITEWYRRIRLVYGISINDKEKGFHLKEKAESYFYNLDAESTEILKSEGVTHILTTNKNWKFGKLLLANNTYAVYQL